LENVSKMTYFVSSGM